jgi:hypothetical protein
MPVTRTCTVCSHAAREEIDSALIRRRPYRKIAERFGVTESALSRHLNDHLADHVQEALREYGLDKGVRVLNRIMGIIERLEEFLCAAEEGKRPREFVMVAAELRRELELVAKLQGDLAQEGTVTIINHPQYIEARALIVKALAPYDDARAAVVKALASEAGPEMEAFNGRRS